MLYVDLSKEDIVSLQSKFATSLSEGEKELLREIKKIKGIAVF